MCIDFYRWISHTQNNSTSSSKMGHVPAHMSYMRLILCFIESTSHGKAIFSLFRSQAEKSANEIVVFRLIVLTVIDCNEGCEVNVFGVHVFVQWMNPERREVVGHRK